MARTVMSRPRASRLWKDWRALCDDIGERRAGTEGEQQAAAYIGETFERAGAAVSVEAFPCVSMRKATVKLRVRRDGRWVPFQANPLVGAPGTPDGGLVEGRPVWLEMPESLPMLQPDALKGRIAMMVGPLPTDPAMHRKLMAARPLAAVQVDDRLPFDWLKNDGVYPYWTKRYGMCPFVAVPYQSAWQWRKDGVDRVRLSVALKQAEAESQNVVAELPGSDPNEPMLILGAHHDTQCNNVGADDNGSGVVTLLELARLLSGRRRRRTIRLISFGTEEQLSVGSAAYARRHGREMTRVGMMLNFDSLASVLGHTTVALVGGRTVHDAIPSALRRNGLRFQVELGGTPFTDQFSFAAAGVPTVDVWRSSSAGGRWQHHSVHDNLDNVSAEPVCDVIGAFAPLIDKLATMANPPFDRRIDRRLREHLTQQAKDLHGVRCPR